MVDSVPKIAVACQGGRTHAAFEAGVLTEILKDVEARNRFELVGFSGTSAGRCALTVWYGLAPVWRRRLIPFAPLPRRSAAARSA